MGTARRNATYSRVSFFTYKPFPFNRIDAYDEFQELIPFGDVQSSLVSWDYVQMVGQPNGQCQIVLKPKKVGGAPGKKDVPWPELIEEGDWWVIDVIKNGTRQNVSWGRIDNITVSASAGGTGTSVVRVVVTGRSAGAIWTDIPVYFNPYDGVNDNAAGVVLQKISDIVVGSADKLVVNYLKGMLGGNASGLSLLGGQIKLPQGLGNLLLPSRFLDAVDFTSHVENLIARGVANTANVIRSKGGGSVWEFVDAWRNPAVNELFVDTAPTPSYPKRLNVYMREKPFVNTAAALASPWYLLPTWNFDATLLQSVNLSRGRGRINHIQLVGDLAATGNPSFFGAYKPRANLDSIDKYGLKRLEERTRYFDLEGTAFHKRHDNWLNLIISWNALNHRYWQGMLTNGEMRAEVRPGQKIAVFNGPLAGLEDVFPADLGVPVTAPGTGFDLMTFYVEGVQHQWAAGEQPIATSNFQVSRGYLEGFRLIDIQKELTVNWKPLAFTGQDAPIVSDTPTLNFKPAADLIEVAQVDAGIAGGAFNKEGDLKVEE